MWPIHGHYQCRSCGRLYSVPWTESAPAVAAPPASGRVRSAGLSATLLVLLLASFATAAYTADAPIVEATGGASLAFARYTASRNEVSPWRLSIVEIEASLPRLAKQGRLRAIRHVLPLGTPEYQVLDMTGDRTVRQQVIVRYLSADIRAAALPPDSIAITPANYHFRYKGRLEIGDRTTYAFAITPRKKRPGLIKGELWLDAQTGAVVRQSGYLVKNPSIFLKRVVVNQETELQRDLPELRVTHLSVDTRLVGRAELTVVERPYTAAVPAPALSEGDR